MNRSLRGFVNLYAILAVAAATAGLAAASCYVQEPQVLTCNQHLVDCGTAPNKWQCTWFTDGGAGWWRDVINLAKAGQSGRVKFDATQGNCTETWGGCGTWATQCPAGTPVTTHPGSYLLDANSAACTG